MSSPTSVSDSAVIDEYFLFVKGVIFNCMIDEILQIRYFTDGMEYERITIFITIQRETCAVVSAVFKPFESIDKNFGNCGLVAFDHEVDVSEDTAVKSS